MAVICVKMQALVDISSDEDFQLINNVRKSYTVKERPNYLEEFDDEEFVKRFRLTRESVLYVLDLIEERIVHRTEI